MGSSSEAPRHLPLTLSGKNVARVLPSFNRKLPWESVSLISLSAQNRWDHSPSTVLKWIRDYLHKAILDGSMPYHNVEPVKTFNRRGVGAERILLKSTHTTPADVIGEGLGRR